jgi:peptidyl-prolyl cis-trans isomerase C
MKAKILAAAILAILVTGCSPSTEKVPRSPALATVNGAPVTVSQFKDKLRFLKLGFTNISGHEGGVSDAKMDLLSELIEEEMYMQEARRLKISVSKAEVDSRLGRAMSGYTAPFTKSLKEEGFTAADFRMELEKKLVAERLIESQVYSRIRVTSDEARRYFDENRAALKRPEKVRARQIVVATRKEAHDILTLLKKGADFTWLAKTRSLSPDSSAGGDLGYFAKDEMPPQFVRVVFRMKPGETSGIVKTSYGYHIFRVEGVMKGGEPSFQEAQPEITRRLAAVKGEGEFEKWLAGLKARTAITVNYDLLRSL